MSGAAVTVGAAVGGALGFLAGGPAVAALGNAGGAMIGAALDDVATRVLSEREQQRVGIAATLSLSEIKQRLDQGDAPRADGFFEAPEAGEADAVKLFEAILLKSRDEYESKKIKHLAAVYSSAVFEPSLSREEVEKMVEMISQFSYSHLVLLAILDRKDDLRLMDMRTCGPGYTFRTHTLLEQLLNLARSGLVLVVNPDGGYHIALNTSAMNPVLLELSVFGKRFATVARLEDISLFDVVAVADGLHEDDEVRDAA